MTIENSIRSLGHWRPAPRVLPFVAMAVLLFGSGIAGTAHATTGIGHSAEQPDEGLRQGTTLLNAAQSEAESPVLVERPSVPGATDGLSSVVDTTAPVFTLIVAGESIDDVSTSESDIFWSVDEPLASGALTLTRTGGNPDPASPHTCTLVGQALHAGAHDHFQLDDTVNSCQEAVALVEGAVYTLTLAGVDTAGNAAESVSQPEVALSALRVVATITVGNRPHGAAFDKDNQQIYFANHDSNTVSVIDTTNNTVTHTVLVGTNPNTAVYNQDPNNGKIYVPNRGANTLSVIATATRAVERTVPIGGSLPADATFDSINNKIYVTNETSNTVSVISAADGSLITTIAVGNRPRAITFDAENQRVYSTNADSNTVSVISTETDTVIVTINVGAGPAGAAFDPIHNRVYISENRADTVSVISTATNSVIATIPVGDGPHELTYDSSHHRVYVPNFGSNTVSVIDTDTNTVVETITVGANPAGSAFDSISNQIYQGNYGTNTVSVIDARVPPKLAVTSPRSSEVMNDVTTGDSDITWSVDKALASGSLTLTRTGGNPDPDSPHTCQFVGNALHAGTHAHFQLDDITNGCREAVTLANGTTYMLTFSGINAEGVAANPITRANVVFDARILATIVVDSQPTYRPAFDTGSSLVGFPKVYVTNDASNTVSVIDTAINTVIDTVAVGIRPLGAVFDPVYQRVYISNYGSDTVSVIDTTSNIVIATIPVGNGPHPPAYDAVNRRVYVPNHISNNVSVINTDTNTITATIQVGTSPIAATFDPVHHWVYVTNRDSHNVSVISTTSNTVIATIAVGDDPHEGAFDPIHQRFYVPNWSSNNVSVIDTATNTVVATVPVNDIPVSIAFDSANRRGYIANVGSDNVSVIDTVSNTVVATIPVGDAPFGVGFDSINNRIYVMNRGSNTVTVIDAGTPPVMAVTFPTHGATINDVTTGASDIAWSVDEPLRSGSLTLTRTGGTADGASPHTCPFTEAALETEQHLPFLTQRHHPRLY